MIYGMYNSSDLSSHDIISNYKDVCERIRAAAESVNRDPASINLIVVTKTFDSSAFLPLIELGHRDFGENKLQEAENKWITIMKDVKDINLHLIGHLQTNKVKKAVELFHTIHTIDSSKRVSELKKHLHLSTIVCRQFFIELNMADEPQKTGLAQRQLNDILLLIDELDISGFSGLMCIPPYEEEPSPYFALLKKIADKFAFQHLSMGMSSDFEKAVQFGATHVRVGSEIFGSRS